MEGLWYLDLESWGEEWGDTASMDGALGIWGVDTNKIFRTNGVLYLVKKSDAGYFTS